MRSEPRPFLLPVAAIRASEKVFGKPGFAGRALTDAHDRLVVADQPLAGLQRRCGGDLPGLIAIPALLEAVRKSRRYGMKLARTLSAQDSEDRYTAFIEIVPRDGEPGCQISIHNWRVTPLPEANQQLAEERRTAIERHAAEIWAMLDAEQRLQAVQGSAPDLTQTLSAMQEGLGRPWTDFVVPQGMSHMQPVHWRLLDGAAVTIEGSERAWRAHLLPRLGQAGEPNGFELLLVSDEAPPEPQRNRRKGDAGKATSGTRLVGREVAPALRQPISRIIANAESIRTRLAGPLADDYADYASEITAAGQHLLGLLDDLSDLEVVESPDFSTAPDRIDLMEVARQAAGILSVRGKEKGIRLVLPNGTDGLEATAEFRRVLQILLNLLGNAIAYSPSGSEVWVRIEPHEGKPRVTVADQGPGLSEEDAGRIFDKFERLGRSGDGGSGLGLYISRRLARAMGGDLSVEAAPGQGARFMLDLPAA